MPRLPRTPLYEVQRPQNNTRVTPIQRVSGEDAVGDALGKQGAAAFEIGSRLRDAQITNEVAKAHNDLNLKLDAEYRQLEKDTGDPTELEAKWQARSKQILTETSGSMTSPMHRRLFDAQAAQLAEGYQIKTRDLTRRKQVDGAIADSARQLDALAETAADPEVSLDVLQSNTETTLAAARRLYKSGFINEQQLADWEVKAGDQLMVGKSVRNEKRVSDLMDAGDAVSIAQARILMEDKDFRADLLPDRREALDDALKVKARAADTFATADRLMAENGGDYGKAIAGARQIEDPELRQDVESRIGTMRTQDEAAQTDLQNATYEKYGDAVRAGQISVRNIPSQDYMTMTQAQISALESLENARATGKSLETDRKVTAAFYELIGAGKVTEAKQLLYDNSDRVSDSDWKSYLSKASTATASQANGSRGAGGIDSVRSFDSSVDRAMERAGLGSDKNLKGEIIDEYERRSFAYQQEHGREPDDKWRNDTLEELTTDVKIMRPGFVFRPYVGKPGGMAASSSTVGKNRARIKVDRIGSIPEEYTQAVLAAFPDETVLKREDLEKYYSAATEALRNMPRMQAAQRAVAQAKAEGASPSEAMFAASIAAFRERGISDPSPEAITEMISYLRSGAEGQAGARQVLDAAKPDNAE
jgi:hypothetical protein